MNTTIFIDIDGVLLTFPDAEKNSYSHSKAFTKSCVDTLNKMTDSIGFKLVVSSAWRIDKSIEYIQKLFKDNGVTGEVIGKTDDPDDSGTISISKSRGEYVQKWLDEHDSCNYIIIDDSEWDLKQTHPDNFYHITDGDVGLQDSDMDNIFEMCVKSALKLKGVITIKSKMSYAPNRTMNRPYTKERIQKVLDIESKEHLHNVLDAETDYIEVEKSNFPPTDPNYKFPDGCFQTQEPSKIDEIIEATKKIKDFDPLS